MEFAHLEVFRAVVEEGTFSRAARRLNLTQPGVSQIIRRLEESVGESLFDRSSRSGSLTDAGLLLLDYAERLVNLRNESRQALLELKSGHSGKLDIAANEFTCLYLLSVLEEYRRFHPMVKVAVRRSLASKIPQEISSRAVELGLLTFRPTDPELRSVVIYRDELAFVMPPQHPLAKKNQVSIKQLGTQTFIAHNVPSPYRVKVLDTFQKHRTPLNMEVELPTLEAIKKFVAKGTGVALLPRIAVEAEIERGELATVPIKELHLERKLRIVYRKASPLSHAARALLSIVERMAQERNGRMLFQKE
jgi:DNA-binding transcriptional LysR family regulator